MLKFLIWMVSKLGSLYLAVKIGGVGTAIMLIVLAVEPYLFTEMSRSNAEDFAPYHGVAWMTGDARNPLYLNGEFRNKCYAGKAKLVFSGLKGIFWHQFYTIIQISVFATYGVYCLLNGIFHHQSIEVIFISTTPAKNGRAHIIMTFV